MKLAKFAWVWASAYIMISILSKSTFSELLPEIRLLPLIYALFFLLITFLSYKYSDRIPPEARLFVHVLTLILVFSFLSPWGLPIGILLLLLSYALILKRMVPLLAIPEVRVVVLVGASIVLAAIPLFMGYVPVIDITARYTEMRFFYLAAGYLTALAISIKPHLVVLLVGEVIAVVSTFRTVGLTVFLAYVLKLIQMGKLAGKNPRKHIPLGIAILCVVVVFLVRYHATLQTYGEWRLSLPETLLYRAGFTYTVYEELFKLGMPWGHFKLLPSMNPKGYVGELFGRNVAYNYTIFGQPVYDFGILGLIEAFFIGMFIREAERKRATEVMSVTLFLIVVEVGIDAFFMAAFAYLAFLSSEVWIWREKHSRQ